MAAKATAAKTRPTRGSGAIGAFVLAIFAVLVVTAALQTSRNSVSSEQERRELASQVSAARAQLEDERALLRQLRAEAAALEEQQLRSDASAQGLLDSINLLGAKAGTLPVRGPGVRLVADNAPGSATAQSEVLDSDLQKLVNGLWRAGAEAISINGQRLTNLSAIRHAGGGITVNFAHVNRPYRVLAIGDPKTLPSRFADTTSGQTWFDLERQVGLQFTMRTQSTLRLPAAEMPSLRFAEPPDTPAGKGSS
jgi:uncharacterized protein YlxW (UPF0749 family)